MELISRFAQILAESRQRCEAESASHFVVREEIKGRPNMQEAGKAAEGGAGLLALGDNADFMRGLLHEHGLAGKLKLIYIDPPFFSKASYDAVLRLETEAGKKLPPLRHFAYEDVWQKDMAGYLTMLCERLLLMKELLAADGTIWVHLDWHVVHYVKVFMDEIFGEKNFVNEIIWQYKSGGSGKRHFARKHDTILVYSKGRGYYFAPPKEKSYNRGFKPYRFKGVKEYRDEAGWYTMVTMKDVWQVDMVGRTAAERTGYATQKPEALLVRIIESASREGDLCADFFCGSGTLAAVCARLGRRFICCDQSPLAVATALGRLAGQGAAVKVAQAQKPAAVRSGDEDGSARACARAEFAVSRCEVAGADKDLFKIELTGYMLTQLPASLDEDGRSAIKNLLTEEPLTLIDQWSVDFAYDGRCFRPQAFFARERGKLPRTCEKLLPQGFSGNICVKTVDALGNSTLTVVAQQGEII